MRIPRMRLVRIFIIGLLSACAAVTSAQSVDRYVIPAAGGFGSSGGMALWSNIGELMVNTNVTPQVILSEGFIQTDTSLITLVSVQVKDHAVNVYPVPASESLNIEFRDAHGDLLIELFDIAGKVQLVDAVSSSPGGSIVYRVDINRLSPGIHLLAITDKASGRKTVLRISKI